MPARLDLDPAALAGLDEDLDGAGRLGDGRGDGHGGGDRTPRLGRRVALVSTSTKPDVLRATARRRLAQAEGSEAPWSTQRLSDLVSTIGQRLGLLLRSYADQVTKSAPEWVT